MVDVHGAPRIEPLTRDEYLTLRASLGSEPVGPADADLHISRTWARNPALMMAQTPLQKFLGAGTVLAARVKEIAILRTGWRCRSGYEFAQHTVFARQVGLTDDEIAQLAEPDPGPDWSALERAVIAAVDETLEKHTVSEATWTALVAHLRPEHIMELLVLIGRYWTVAVMTNTLRVQLEPGVAEPSWLGAP